MNYITKPISWLLILCLTHNPIAAFYWLTGLMFWTPYSAVADAFMDQAAQGQTLGTSHTVPNVDSTTGTMTLTNGAVAGQTIQQNGLFQQIQPGSMDGIAASYGDNAAMGNNVNTGVSALTTGTSIHAQAYQTLLSSNKSMPDLSNDPIWAASDMVFTQKSPLINDLFTGCNKTTSMSQTSCSVHVPDYQTCQKTLAYQTCTVTRTVTYNPVITVQSGYGSVSSCGPGCTDLSVGIVGYRTLSGSCSYYSFPATFNVLRPNTIISATLTGIVFDDYTEVKLNNNVVYTGSTGWGCPGDLKTNWTNTPNTDLTSQFRAGGAINIEQDLYVVGMGDGYLNIRVIAAPDYTDTLIDNPAGCRQRLFDSWPPTNTTAPSWTSSGSLNDQASTPWWQCTDARTSMTFSSGAQSAAQLGPYLNPILPDAPPSPPAPMCFAAQTRIPGTVALPCFTDVSGYQQCPQVTYDTAAHNSCDPIAANPHCAWVGEQCAAGAVSPITGTCMQFIETYDCGTTAPGQCNQTNSGEQTICNSSIRCMGGECVNQTTESNQDFIKDVAALQTLNQAQQSNGCNAAAGDCSLFGGQAMECQMADLSILGSVDCCNMPIQGGWIQYMQLAAQTWYLADTSVEAYSIANNGALLTDQVGAWNLVTTDTVLQAPIGTATQTYEAITQSFTSMYDSVVTTFGQDVTSELGAVTGFFSEIEQQAMQQMSVWVMDNFGVQAGEALFSYSVQPTADAAGNMVTEGTAVGMSDMLASIINVVGIIYAIYQIAKMVVQLIFACTQDEVKLDMLKEQKLCTYSGEIGNYCSVNTLFGCVARKEAYCCFSSPFARIFQQQARPQLGMNFGAPQTPSCGGLSIKQISTLNFKQMDFSEWINMMKISGGLPIDGATANSQYSVGTVTASPMTGVVGPNAQSTLNSQTQGSNIDAIRQSIVNGM